MARIVNAVSIFLSSPSDVSHEREIVAVAVDEWNERHSRHTGVSFDLIRWERSIAAGFGTDGQTVINDQTNDFDLFLGLLWTRLGTPTARAASGTVEEYQRAVEKLKVGEVSDIGFFIKDAPVDLNSIDADQLRSLTNFKSEIRSNGALTMDFRDEDTLKVQVAMFLDKASRFYAPSGRLNAKTTHHLTENTEIDQQSSSIAEDNPVDEDIGLFDALESLEQHAAEATSFVGQLTEELTKHNHIVDEATKEFSLITEVRPLTHSDAKPYINSVSQSMNCFSDFIELNLSSYGENLFAMANDVRDIIRVSYDWVESGDFDLSAAINLREMLTQMHSNMAVSHKSFLEFLSTLSSLQRTTSTFNKARRRLLNAGKSLSATNEQGRSLIAQALDEVGRLIIASK